MTSRRSGDLAYAVEDYLHKVEWAIKNGTPLEHLVLNKALRHYADINAQDVLKAEEMLKQAQAICAEERGQGMKFILTVAIIWLSVASVSIIAICVSHNPKWALLMLIPACLVSIKQKEDR